MTDQCREGDRARKNRKLSLPDRFLVNVKWAADSLDTF